MKKLLVLLLTLGAVLPALAQRNVPLPGDVGPIISRSRPIQGTFRAVVVNGSVKYQDYLGNLIDPATIFNIVSTTVGSGTATSGITQTFADNRYRIASVPISYTDLTNRPTIPTVPTSLSAFTNDPGFQTAGQVSTAISSATTAQASSQTAIDAAQNTAIAGKLPTSFTTTQAAVDNAQSTSIAQNTTDIAGKLSSSTYTANRSVDQAATTAAQNTANTALTTANSATATAAGKVDKTTTITINGVSQDLSQPRSFTIAGTNSTTLTQVSQLSNDANYQSGSQVGAAISSAVNSVTNNQQTTDNNQTLSISQKLPTTTFNSYSAAQATTDQGQSSSIAQNASDIGNRLLTSTYTTNRSSDQAATTSAQNTANTALTTANSATATGASNSSAITTLQNAGYQTAGQVATAVNSATTTVVSNQTAVDAAQNTNINSRLLTSTYNSFTTTQQTLDNNQASAIAAATSTANSATATGAANTSALAGKQPTITSASSLTAASLVVNGLSTGDSLSNQVPTFKNVRDLINLKMPSFIDFPYDTTYFSFGSQFTPKPTAFRGLISVTGSGASYNALTGVLSFTGGSGSSGPFSLSGTTAYYNGGLVGIGTNTPYSLFTVAGNAQAAEFHLTGANNAQTDAYKIGILPGFGPQIAGGWAFDNSVNMYSQGNGNIRTDGNLLIRPQSRDNLAFFANSGGWTIGNGTNSANALLDVNGTLRAAGNVTLGASLTVAGTTSTNSLSFVNGGVMNGLYVLASASAWTPVATGVNSSTLTDLLSSGLGIPVIVRDQASIQALINSLPSSTTAIPRLYFYGKYDFSASANTPLTISKNLEMIGANGATFDGGTVNGFLTLINNISTRLTVENITFRSNSTTSAYALTYINEQGDCKNMTFRRCRWHAPKGNYNAIGINTWNGTSGSFVENVLFDECVVDSVGRMGGESLAQKNDGVIRIKNLTYNNCRFDNVGLYNPANVTKASAQINGMALSISGDIQGVQINNFVARNALVGIELVSAKDVNIVNPTITGARSSTYSDAGILPATGISITDGGSTDRGVLNRSATNITITGGSVNMAGKGIGTYYADRVTITGTKFNAGAYMEIQHATRLNFNSFDYEMTGKNFIASFEDVKNSQIRDIRFSRENNTVTPIYQPINLDGNTAGNQFSNISIVTNTAYNGGNPDNYFNDQQPYRLRYINEAGTNNSISNIFLNGIKQPDAIQEVIPGAVITAAGSMTLLSHIKQVSFNPPTTAISSYTLTLPSGSLDGQQIDIYFGGALNNNATVVTAGGLTINGPGGNAPIQANTPTGGTAGQTFTYRYRTLTGRWHRIL